MTTLPEVNFVDTDPEEIKTSVIAAYEIIEDRKLAEADPVRLFLLSIANVIVQQRVLINDIGKQNLLFYSRDKVLDHKGFAWGTPRIESEAATTTMRFNLSIAQESAKTISKDELVATNDGEFFFKTTEDAVIKPNDLYVDVSAICTKTGSVGNGIEIGKIDTLVKPVSFIKSIENITVSEGGSEREGDGPYRERIHQAPEKLSTAGPTGAYEYWAKTASALIADVYVSSPIPGEVDVRVLLENGELPQQELIDSIFNVVNDRKIRPLTDSVFVGAPDVINYDVDVTYYIEKNTVKMSLIQENIEKAINDYVTWQRSKIGRDINPSRLISDCIRAGARRVDVNSPSFSVVNENQVAVASAVSITFGGVEDD